MPLGSIFGKPTKAPVEEPAEEVKKEEQPQNFATRDELANAIERMNAAIERLGSGQQIVIERPVETVRDEPPPELDEATLARVLEDDPKAAAAMIAKHTKDRIAYERQAIVRDHVQPLENFGANALADLSKRAAIADMPHYKKFQTEIDGHMAKLPPTLQGNPAAWKTAHDAVCGRHVGELIDEAVEAKLRQGREDGSLITPTASQKGKDEKKVPTLVELAGEDAARALELKGLDANAFAKRLGYDSWEHYADVAAKLPVDDV